MLITGKFKFISILLIISMLLSLSACSSSGSSDPAGGTATTATPEPTEVPTSTPTPVPTSTPTPTPTPIPDPNAHIALKLPTKYQMPVKEDAGTVEAITYMAKDYLGDGPDYEKKAYVYLPYDYDESKQYNVLYLCHGIGGSESEWGLNNPNGPLKRILDNLFKDGGVESFIVVTPNGRAYAISGVLGNDLFYKFGYELRNDLIPYMESHYSTYAEYDENGYDMTATRTHRAIAGLSMGGMQTINIGICECLDLFSWFGAFSAAPTSYSDKFVPDVNFMWQEKKGGHDFNIWYLGLYNFAQIAFGHEWSYDPSITE